jgi:hypothetical protein
VERFILDTNILIGAIRSATARAELAAWQRTIAPRHLPPRRGGGEAPERRTGRGRDLHRPTAYPAPDEAS